MSLHFFQKLDRIHDLVELDLHTPDTGEWDMNSRTVSFASWTPDIIICWASSGRRPRYFTNPSMLAWYVAVVITSEPLWRYLLKQVKSIIHQILNSSCHRIEAHKWLIGWRDFRLDIIKCRYMYEGKYKCTFKTKFGVIKMVFEFSLLCLPRLHLFNVFYYTKIQ